MQAIEVHLLIEDAQAVITMHVPDDWRNTADARQAIYDYVRYHSTLDIEMITEEETGYEIEDGQTFATEEEE